MGDIVQKMIQCEINKLDEEKHLVYGIFLSSDVEDLQGDIVFKEELEETAHLFMLDYQQIGEVHKTINPNCKIVESYIDRTDDETWKWKGVVKVLDEDVWQKVKTGEYAAFSIGGQGERVPV